MHFVEDEFGAIGVGADAANVRTADAGFGDQDAPERNKEHVDGYLEPPVEGQDAEGRVDAVGED